MCCEFLLKICTYSVFQNVVPGEEGIRSVRPIVLKYYIESRRTGMS